MFSEKYTFVVIQDWMLDLELDLTETVVFAIIYGFSQDGETTFRGSWKYLQDHAKCSRRKVALVMKKLVEKGYIKKRDIFAGGVKFCEYFSCTSGARGALVVHERENVVHDVHGGGAPHAPNNIVYNDTTNVVSNNDSKGRSAKFVPPTLEEVAAYVAERRTSLVNPQKFLDYYTANGWMVGKSHMKDWKAAVRNWESREKDNSNKRRNYDPGSPAAYRQLGKNDYYGESTI